MEIEDARVLINEIDYEYLYKEFKKIAIIGIGFAIFTVHIPVFPYMCFLIILFITTMIGLLASYFRSRLLLYLASICLFSLISYLICHAVIATVVILYLMIECSSEAIGYWQFQLFNYFMLILTVLFFIYKGIMHLIGIFKYIGQRLCNIWPFN